MRFGVSIDPYQLLDEGDEARLLRRAAELGYDSAWTPSGPDPSAFDRCLRWHQESGLATGISVAPAHGQPPSFYAEHARRVWEATEGRFTLGVGAGHMLHAGKAMRPYLHELRSLLPAGVPLYVGAMGPMMLRLGGEVGDGVAPNWCSHEQVVDARRQVTQAAADAHRQVPVIAAYIRTAVDPDPTLARATLSTAMLAYALGQPAYRVHFERKGFADEMKELEAGTRSSPSDALLAASGAHGRPGEVRAQFERLAEGLDIAIVRVLVTRPGDAESAERVIEECAPR